MAGLNKVDVPPTPDTIVVESRGVGLIAFMVQYADGQVKLLSWPDANVQVRGASWDAIWPEFVRRAMEGDNGA